MGQDGQRALAWLVGALRFKAVLDESVAASESAPGIETLDEDAAGETSHRLVSTRRPVQGCLDESIVVSKHVPGIETVDEEAAGETSHRLVSTWTSDSRGGARMRGNSFSKGVFRE